MSRGSIEGRRRRHEPRVNRRENMRTSGACPFVVVSGPGWRVACHIRRMARGCAWAAHVTR
eukprot:446986-Prymnesium_polylepis.1